MLILRIITLLGLLFFLGSCELFNKPEEIPAYIKIETPVLISDPQTQGANSNAITDGWIYINDEPIGVLELPAEFPVLTSGPTNIKVFAGIKENGFEAQREIYPFYAAYETDSNLFEDATITINPIFTYKQSAKFVWTEDFEGLKVDFDSTQFSLASINQQTQVVRSGIRSGIISLNSSNYFIEAFSGDKMELPGLGANVYFEIDFNSDMDFEVYLISNNTDGTIARDRIIYLSQTNGIWKKVYINLTDFISFNKNAETFQIGLRCNIEDVAESATIYLDNLKVISE